MDVRLDDISEFIIDCEHKTAPTQDFGYPSIRTPNIGKGNLLLENVNRVSEIVYKEWTKRGEPKEGDLIIAREAPVGNVAIIPKGLKVCLGQRTVLVRPNRTLVDPKYLCYLMLGEYLQSQILTKTTGSTVAHLNMKDIRDLRMPTLPVLEVQQKIASILSAYDELIENNKQRIKLLGEMAEEIYKEWFVRFRFPGYESTKFFDEKGKEVPHSTPGALPEAWERTSAEKLFDINIGKTPPREESQWFTNEDNGVKWVSIRDIGNSNVFLSDTSEKITNDGVSRFNMRIAKRDTIILSFKLTVGKIAILNEDMVTNEAIAHFNVSNSSGLNREYTYCYLNNFQFAELGNTSSIGNAVNSKIVKAMPFIYPQKSLLTTFKTAVEPIFEQIRTLGMKNELLQQTRDLLLPRLISGKLSVKHLVEPELELLSLAAEPESIYSK